MPKEYYDPETGEALPYIADGSRPTPAASNIGQLLALCEDGKLDEDISNDTRKLVHALRAVAYTNGGKAKGRLNIVVDVSIEGDMIMLQGDYTVKLPKEKRKRTVAFATEDGRITPNKPNQHAFFGVRSVPEKAQQFADVEATASPLKDA